MLKVAAKWVFDGRDLLPDYCVVLDDTGRVLALDPAYQHTDARQVEGLLAPGFVNAHCHLELSHLRGSIARHSGMMNFASSIVTRREGAGPQPMYVAAEDATEEAMRTGTVAMADVSNQAWTNRLKRNTRLYTHTFIELLGALPERARTVFNQGFETMQAYNGLSASLVPHAPYSVSLPLFTLLGFYSDSYDVPYSVHYMETEAELEWVRYGTGHYRDFLAPFGITQKPDAEDVSQLVLPRLPRHSRVLLVHCTEMDARALAAAEAGHSRPWYCLCPRSNDYIHRRQPHYSIFPWHEGRVCLGTDSLASNDDLNLLNEVLFAQQQAPHLALPLLLRAATLNGAQYLGLAWAGSLAPGKTPGLLQITGYEPETQKLRMDSSVSVLQKSIPSAKAE